MRRHPCFVTADTLLTRSLMAVQRSLTTYTLEKSPKALSAKGHVTSLAHNREAKSLYYY